MSKNGEPASVGRPPFWRCYLYPMVAAGVLVILTTLIFPLPSRMTPLMALQVGDLATEDVVAPSTLPLKRSAAELEHAKDSAIDRVPLVLRYDRAVADSVTQECRSFFARMDEVQSRGRVWDDLLLAFPHLVIPADLEQADAEARRLATATLDSTLNRVYRIGLLANRSQLPTSESRTVTIQNKGVETIVRRERLLETTEARALLRRQLEALPLNEGLRAALEELARQWLVPNLILDLQATENRKRLAISSIQVNKGVILKDAYIVRAGERITNRHLEGLQALADFERRSSEDGRVRTMLLPMTARLLFLGAVFVGFGVALRLARPGFARELRALLALSVLYLVVIILHYLIYYQWEVSGYLLPLTVATMLATILLSLGVGLAFAVFLAVVLGIVSGFDFAPVFLALTAGSVAALAVRHVRKRYHFYRPILFLALTYVIVITLMEALRFTEPQQILERASYGLLNGVLSPIITIGLLPIFETTFRLTTDITLLELADMNHPLLRRLSVAAPGTYHHSIIVANLCEAAAEAVGANPLLARVGAYFHDIGKMEKPEYFVENQMGRKNKHDELAPSMSALILSAHIKSGAEMAREARLPEVIVDFVEQHHGTTQMSYFYRKATEQAGHEIPDSDFRYPGPKPKLKETAILMLADSTEAVSRTLDDPRPNRLRSAIHQVITDKFMAGQLADCPLTLADLSRIEDAFLHLLLGAFHGRIRYPHQEDEERQQRKAILG